MLRKPVLTPQTLLQQVMEVFSSPADFIKVNKVYVRLNKMGIRISEDSTQPANNLELTEVVIENESPRVVTLADFPARELQPGKPFPSVEPFPAYPIGRSHA
jgi:hypothetical protein